MSFSFSTQTQSTDSKALTNANLAAATAEAKKRVTDAEKNDDTEAEKSNARTLAQYTATKAVDRGNESKAWEEASGYRQKEAAQTIAGTQTLEDTKQAGDTTRTTIADAGQTTRQNIQSDTQKAMQVATINQANKLKTDNRAAAIANFKQNI